MATMSEIIDEISRMGEERLDATLRPLIERVEELNAALQADVKQMDKIISAQREV